MRGLPRQYCHNQHGGQQQGHEPKPICRKMLDSRAMRSSPQGANMHGVLPVFAANGAIVEAGRFYYLNSIRKFCADLGLKSAELKVLLI